MRGIRVISLFIIFSLICECSVYADTYSKFLSQNVGKNCEAFIQKQYKKSKIPDMFVVVVNGNKTIYSKGFGNVSDNTLFELGSTSKAYTALGILKLEEESLIDLNAPVDKYLPGFIMTYKGKPAHIKIEQLLHHTSGISSNTIGDIPVSNQPDALKKTVELLVGKELESNPGDRFSYATINYDVLGLVIEKVSRQSFENFMRNEVFLPLGLNNTFAGRQPELEKRIIEGYKIGYGRSLLYKAPQYRGNVPAGYIITNGKDMATWLKQQINIHQADNSLGKAIEKAHMPDRTVPPDSDGGSYGGGWIVYQKGGGEYSHGGENPNYSSYVIFRPEEQLGVAVLCNMNSSYAGTIARGVMDIMLGNTPKQKTKDMYRSLDYIAVAIICISIPFLITSLYYLLNILYQIVCKNRRLAGARINVFWALLKIAATITIHASSLYMIPWILFDGLPWNFIKVWAPQSIIVSLCLIFSAGSIFTVYYYLNRIFPRDDDKSFFSVITLSVLSGFGNALIIFIINLVLSQFDPDDKHLDVGLLFYFIIGIVIYVLGQRIVRLKLITVTNNIVYKKRVNLIERIQKTSYQDIENLEKGDLIACLNNDTEIISTFANIIITAVANSVTLICCFIYLGMVNLWGVLVSIVIAALALTMYYFVGISAEKLWDKVRDNQSLFIRYINDLAYGFKELSLNRSKREGFNNDILESCRTYRDKNIDGNFKFANVFVIGELLFTFVIGAVVFLFPLLFKEIEGSELIQYVFIFLYMTGPIHGILDSIPEVMHVKISWKRIKGLEKYLSEFKVKPEERECEQIKNVCIELKDIEYSYKNCDDLEFKVGPVNCSFKPGEITFITGGNGSGKSTLAKLITGLYRPDKGKVFINGAAVNEEGLGKYYSAIFSDYYLFNKLYGIDWKHKVEEIRNKMKRFRIENKLTISNGELSTTKLSTGQRKRIALMISYLEDRPIYLFDEWAADQDPEFRRIFYNQILPELKKKGKTVIAITHDDGYFNTADKVIKMEMGEIKEVTYEKN
ncbi:cyclic peptide export ABC transporter [Aminipila sp.]|uniref:cyclic peptide export ABC transporter n=1 Tax=Aminipila sp. TaxID=2060095 RepID=UPI00289D716C|nr:cyclic peptide export ABC transporter [Aminipila sp.]